MPSRDYSEYDRATGLFTGLQRTSTATPPATAKTEWIEGRHHWRQRRVNLQTRTVENYTPPEPTLDERKARQSALVARRMLDQADEQRRWIREIVLALATGQAVPASALSALQRIDTHAAALRGKLEAIAAAPDAATIDAIQP